MSEESQSTSDYSSTQTESEDLSKHKKWDSDLIIDDYMEDFITQGGERSFICEYCRDDSMKRYGKEDFWCESLYSHIGTSWHKGNTPKKELEKLLELKKVIVEYEKKKGLKRRRVDDGDREAENDKNYLQLIGFLVSERLSFSQIERLGSLLKNMAKDRQLEFLKTKKCSFGRKKISDIVVDCFRPGLLNELYQKISNTEYSFSIDGVTLAGKNLCALQVKYIDEDKDKSLAKIQNKLIGVTDLKDTSDATKIYDIVKKKLYIAQSIQQNMIGITHDNAQTLSSKKEGLVGLMTKDNPSFFMDLPDPCHCVNLVAKHSLKVLPKEIMSFVDNIHSYFSPPQRKALLEKIQQSHNFKVSLPVHYVKTRWLSLGECLTRLLQIWESLKLYVNVLKDLKEKEKAAKVKIFEKELNNDLFLLKIRLLSFIVNKLNNFSIALQSRDFDIGKLKHEMEICFRSLFQLPYFT